MPKLYHELITYFSTAQGFMDILKVIAPLGLLIYAIKRFSLDYRKPRFKILKVQTNRNYDDKENINCHIKMEIYNPASFDNMIYLAMKTVYNKTIDPFFYPKEITTKIVVPANSDIIHFVEVYDSVSAQYYSKRLRLRLTDAKGKMISKYIKWRNR